MKNREKIQLRLKERGYTQRQVAELGKVSEQHVCLVIAGKRKSARISKIIEDLTGIKEKQ